MPVTLSTLSLTAMRHADMPALASLTIAGRATAHLHLLSLGGWPTAPRELEALLHAAVLAEPTTKTAISTMKK